MLYAQAEMSTLRGKVTDAQGAALPKIPIVVTDAAGVKREAMTNEQGEYVVAYLKPGTYKVKIEEDRFQTLEAEGILLEPGQA